jgi:hypothetical protein
MISAVPKKHRAKALRQAAGEETPPPGKHQQAKSVGSSGSSGPV